MAYDDCSSSKRRRKHEHKRDEEMSQHKRDRSRKQRRSSSKKRRSSSSSQIEKKKRRKSKHKKKKKYHRDKLCSRSSESDCDDKTEIMPSVQNKSGIIDPINGERNSSFQSPNETKQQSETVQTKGPMTQGQYLQLQSQVREVIDPATGRMRLVRGTGEIIERIVTKHEHQQLNANATRGDGDRFSREVVREAMRRIGR
jgi:hypothetical protein